MKKSLMLMGFGYYFIKLKLLVVFGLHHTANPLDLRWRWNYWKRRENSINRRE
ncbi:MAG: hypothetical protein KDB79_15630 [Acidobacteria bacterium]|nr:hypothetical protein [Acidobacteriota bacterium]